MSYLQKCADALNQQKQQNQTVFNYAIPELWDVANVICETKIVVNDGHILVNPYEYFQQLIKQVYLSNKQAGIDYHQPYFIAQPNRINNELANGDWIKASYVYSMMIRSSASFDHDRSGTLEVSNMYHLKETGTFIKALAYLPLLKSMGIDVIYMLPISKYSLKDKKGELGSPYGVSNFFELDQGLKDPLTGELTSVEDEFKAFVEACHLLDMKVIIDIIPRTNSVNSDLIVDHPDWFYWIPLKELANYKPPHVSTLDKAQPAKKEFFDDLFKSKEVIKHLKKFVLNPKDTDPVKWEQLQAIYKQGNHEILDLVQQMFEMTIAPAFSDFINDPQPAWSDVTYFRLYLDHPKNSQPYLKKIKNLQPYILYDVAKASYNPGNIVNQPLWDTLANIIPFYQSEFGIDGARIDMGHALPEPLITMILDNARAIDPNFCFIAEELDVANAKVSKEKGYNMIIGDGFIRLPRVKEGLFNAFVYGATSLESPLFAVGETHDTPRLAARDGEEALAMLVTLTSLFIPNTIPFLNSGQEVYERQPMNTGLDCRENEAFLLDPSDKRYGKLALFDKVAFDYNHPRRWEIPTACKQVYPIREQYLNAMLNLKNTYPLGFNSPYDRAAGLAIVNKNKCLLMVVNTQFDQPMTHTVKLDQIPSKFLKPSSKIKLLFSSLNNLHPNLQVDSQHQLILQTQPAEFMLFEIKA